MGLFDLPAPAFAWLDGVAAAWLPAWLRLILWGAIGAAVSMGLYLWLSHQARIAQGKRDMAEARRRLDTFDGEFADAWPLIRNLLGTSFRQVGRVGGPAVLASLPLLALLVWLSTAYGHAYPNSGAAPEIHTEPAALRSDWINGPASEPPHIRIADQTARIIADIPLSAPVPVIHKRQWWNLLIGNPAGYLPGDAAVERIHVELPAHEYLPIGPDWMRGWMFTFFASLIAVSVALKVGARIE